MIDKESTEAILLILYAVVQFQLTILTINLMILNRVCKKSYEKKIFGFLTVVSAVASVAIWWVSK